MSLTMTDRPASAPPAEFAARRTADELAAGDEAALVARAVSGDRQAVGQLVAAHQQRIARLVQRLLAWPDDVDDVVQDVFVHALRSLARFDGHSSLATWLVRIAINRCRSHQRRRWLRLGFSAAAECGCRNGGDGTRPYSDAGNSGRGTKSDPAIEAARP